MSDDSTRVISRRDLLRGVGIAGAAAVSVGSELTDSSAAEQTAQGGAASPGAATEPGTPPRREAFEQLTAAEADLLEAVVDRLIPNDEHGPGAREARAAHYIDRALGGALAGSRAAYSSGLAALDAFATTSRGRGFLQLTPAEQDAVLSECESGRATGFANGSAAFFSLVLTHTRQGMFGDPYYGGNANFAGWDLLGYPGVRTMVTAADQQALESGELKPVRRSAYDYEGFNKATVRSADGGDAHRGH